MKTATLLITLLALCGCTSTEFTREGGLKRTSFLQKSEISFIEVKKDGSVTMKGYKNDGGNEALSMAVEAAVTAAIKSAAPIP
jgi:hypothetical protein